MKKIIALLVAAVLAGSTACTQDISSGIDKLFSWATPATPGCVCAISQNGKVIVNRAYGSADLERDVPITPNSIFDAGSLTKQFVAAATLLLVEEGRLSLSGDIRKYIPELPDYGHKITIDHLLTHTSGLRDWTGIAPLAAKDVDALQVVLRQRGLNFVPGEEWSYTNSGYVLLKEMIARISGMPFSEFAGKRLFGPLGMKMTTYRHNLRDVIRGRALAYEKENGRWEMAMLFDNDRGGGGALFSTASDLLIWNEALTNGGLGRFVTEKIHEKAKLSNGRELSYARGLIVDIVRGGIKAVWHTGSAAGYKSFLGRYPEKKLSVAIMCNAGDGPDRVAFARRILDLFVPGLNSKSSGTNEPADDEGVTKQELSNKAGLFFSEQTGHQLHVIVDNAGLRVAGGPVLVPVSGDRFRNPHGELGFMSQDKFELHFLSQDRFELRSMEGKITRYRRARPYAPAPDHLKAFAGRFESDEIGSVFRIEAGKGALVARLDHSPARSLEFRPVDPDTFQRGRMTLRFLRDRSGKVVVLEYSNPLVRNVKFTRLR